MEKIFIVSAYGGQYDDAWETNLYALRDVVEAELAVLHEEERHKRLLKIDTVVDQVFGAYLHSAVYDMKKIPDQPRGPARTTKENMKLHEKALAEWQAIVIPLNEHNNNEQNRIFREARAVAKQKAIELGADYLDLKTLGFTETGEYHAYAFEEDTSFHFEELELRNA